MEEKKDKKNVLLCPYYKSCGGCQLQKRSYAEQLYHKQCLAIETLGKFGHVEEIIGAEDYLHYRNKVHAAFGLDEKGKVVSGIYKAGTHKIVNVDQCLIDNETADSIILSIRHMLREFKIQVFDERSGKGWLRHVLVRRGYSTGEVMVVLVAVDPIFKLQKPFLKKLLEKHPEITTVVLNINDRFGPVVLGTRNKVLFGSGTIEDELCLNRFRISPNSFYQINSAQTEKLYAKAIDFAGLTGNETVLDAYCGIGSIAITAASRAKQVVGVEINKDAVFDAITNARINKIKNCWFTAGDAGEYMEQMASEKVKPDVVFMDPPRAGSDEKFLSSLVKCAPQKIVYISCNIETQARDLGYLEANGYKVRRLQPVDMFPFTSYVECICLLSKKDVKHNDYVKIGLDTEDYYRIKVSHT